MTVEDTKIWYGEKEVMPGIYLSTPQSRNELFVQQRIEALLVSSDLPWLEYEAEQLRVSIKALLYSNQELKGFGDDTVCADVCC